ncbi:hypothetical protein B0H17DRAFT_1211042 [Mycena rosella]|uniref:Uncharacterized protein n=1 Tax=Mycena rosella TaxID=1033263 RepID=A0AAD7CVK7_MYCRO|nr:hypothetical protein B0H17DRAFT_1211042 [Mycena rosella]
MSTASANLVPLIAPLPLKRLLADLRPFFISLPPSHALFAHLTHLEMTGASDSPTPEDMGIWSQLIRLPQLTHLSFHESGFIPICSLLLQNCESLAVLVSFNLSSHSFYMTDLAQGPRFVLMSRGYYSLNAPQTGERDCWSRAEDFITQRRSEGIHALQYELVVGF